MSKKLKPLPATASIKAIPGTSYIIVNGDRIANLLTPTVEGKDGVIQYNLFIGAPKPKRLPIDRIAKLTKADIEALRNPTDDDQPSQPETK